MPKLTWDSMFPHILFFARPILQPTTVAAHIIFYVGHHRRVFCHWMHVWYRGWTSRRHRGSASFRDNIVANRANIDSVFSSLWLCTFCRLRPPRVHCRSSRSNSPKLGPKNILGYKYSALSFQLIMWYVFSTGTGNRPKCCTGAQFKCNCYYIQFVTMSAGTRPNWHAGGRRGRVSESEMQTS